MESNNRLLELMDGIARHVDTLDGTDLSDLDKVQAAFDQIKWSIAEIGDGAARQLEHAKGMTSEELQNGWYWATRETYKLSNVLRRILRFDPGWKQRLATNYIYLRKAYKYCPPPLHPEKYTHPSTAT